MGKGTFLELGKKELFHVLKTGFLLGSLDHFVGERDACSEDFEFLGDQLTKVHKVLVLLVLTNRGRHNGF